MQTGASLLHYRLAEKIGEGGMGQVWRAADTTLGRDVAIKILPPEFASDPERLARFDREAKVLASLNHPNIAAIHGFHEAEGVRFLAMEMVPGEGLDQRIARGAIPVEEAKAIALKIAEALEYAHERGIVHRDLKPANIRITLDGTVKVLDFGLAKAIVGDPTMSGPVSTPTILPTVTSAGTAVGMILGTAAYMSPEQARGKPVDRRADIWAFGVVAVEMLTGKRLFDGETVSDTIAGVLTRPLELDALPYASLWKRCLERDPKLRLRDIGEARISLERPAESKPKPASRASWPLVAALALVSIAALAGWLRPTRSSKPAPPPLRLELTSPKGTSFDVEGGPVSISADGRVAAFAAHGDGSTFVWVHPLGGGEPRQVPGSLGAYEPFLSPDGSSVGFFTDKLMRWDIGPGGAPVALAPITDSRGGSWSPRGTIVYAPDPTGPLQKIPAGGGTPVPATTLDASRGETGHWRPQFLPDGTHFLYFAASGKPGESAVVVGSLDDATTHRVMAHDGPARFAAPDRLVFVRGDTLLSRRFDPSTFEVSGDAETIATGVQVIEQWANPAFSTSQSGLLAWHRATGVGQPQVFDRTGVPGPRLGEPGDRNLELSPDGRLLAVDAVDAATKKNDLWILDLERGVRTRVTSTPERQEIGPVFSADGSAIYHAVRDGDVTRIVRRLASGVGGEQEIARGKDLGEPIALFPDGARLLIETFSPERRGDLEVLDVTDGTRAAFVATAAHEESGRVSPDGRLIAYMSQESGRNEIYIQPFPPTGARWQVSGSGGMSPRWRRDGGELFYVEANRQLVAVPVRLAPQLELGKPVPLFRTSMRDYVVSADGRRILAVAPPDADANAPVQVRVTY